MPALPDFIDHPRLGLEHRPPLWQRHGGGVVLDARPAEPTLLPPPWLLRDPGTSGAPAAPGVR